MFLVFEQQLLLYLSPNSLIFLIKFFIHYRLTEFVLKYFNDFEGTIYIYIYIYTHTHTYTYMLLNIASNEISAHSNSFAVRQHAISLAKCKYENGIAYISLQMI